MLTTRVSYNAEVQLSLYVRKYFRISYVLRKYHTFVLLEHNTLVYFRTLYHSSTVYEHKNNTFVRSV